MENKTFRDFYFLPEGGHFGTVNATSHEAVYRGICCFYMPKTKVVVIDAETKEAHWFSRELDENGNLKKVIIDGKK